MDPVLLHEIPKNSKEVIRVEITEFKGKKLLNIWTWFQNEAGDYLPSKKGIALSVDKIAELREALEKATDYLNAEK